MSTKNGNKTSSTSRSSSTPRKNLGKRIHHLIPQSRLENVSNGHSCTERFTELVSCHRGYGSVALYAVFSVFILAFLYVIWKILSAHTSRSGNTRRPGSTNSTNVTKMTPTNQSLTANGTALKWVRQGHIVHHARPQDNKGRGSKMIKVHLTGDRQRERTQSSDDSPYIAIRTPLFTIPVSRSTMGPSSRLPMSKEEPVGNYSVPTDWMASPAIREPTVVRSAPIPSGYNYFFRPNRDFMKEGEITARIERPIIEGLSDYDDSRKREWQRWEAKRVQIPRVQDVPAWGPPRIDEKQNLQNGYDSSYGNLNRGDHDYRENRHKPKPPSLFDGYSEIPPNTMRTEHKEEKLHSKKREKLDQRHYYHHLARPHKHHSRPGSLHGDNRGYHHHLPRSRKHHSRHGSSHDDNRNYYHHVARQHKHHSRPGSLQDDNRNYYHHLPRPHKHHSHDRSNVADEDGNHEESESSRRRTIGHHQHRVGFHHHKKVKHRHENIYRARQADGHRHNHHGNNNNEEYPTKSKRKHRIVLKLRSRGEIHHDHVHPRKPVHRLSKHVFRSSSQRHRKHEPRRHSNIDRKHTIPDGKRSKPSHPSVQLSEHPRVRVLGYRRYLQYRRHHSLQEESRGKWRKSRHRVRTCKTLHTFSTTGTVKLSRTKYKSKFLYTMLVCKPVRFRIHRHRQKLRIRRAQLCHNRWYITSGLIHVKRATKSPAVPRYTVRLCTHSYARKMMLKSSFGRRAKHASTRIKNRKSTRSRHRARKMAAKQRKHHAKKIKRTRKHHHRKTKKKNKGTEGKKTWGHKHLANKKKQKRKHLSHKSEKNRHIQNSSKFRKTKETRKKSRISKKDFIRHNPSGKRGKKFDATKSNSGSDFFFKLLQVLKLAKQKQSTHGDVFGSLKHAVERIIQSHGTHRKSAAKHVGKSSKIAVKAIKKMSGHVQSHTVKPTAILTTNSPKISKGFIQNVLEKVLPYVLQNVKSNGISKAWPTVAPTKRTKPTTKPNTTSRTTKPTTKPNTTTKTTKPTSKPNTTSRTTQPTDRPKPTTKPKTPTEKPNGADLEAVLQSILPLLLKRAHQTRAAQTTTPKPSAATKTTAAPTQPKKKQLKDLLANLGLGSLDLGSLGKPHTNKIAKPTQTANKVLEYARLTSTTTPTTRIPWSPAVSLPSDRNGQVGVESTLARPPTLPLPPLPPPLKPSPKPHPFLPAKPIPPPFSLNPSRNVGTSPDPFTKHILCFGDSLTSGFYNHGKKFHPYSIMLNQLLNTNGRGVHYHVDTSGKAREMVHGSMTRRLPMVFGNTSHVDWAVILGGTNDVAHVKDFGEDDSFMNQLINVWRPKIVQDIISLHETSYRFGARTILLTIPESAYEAWPDFKTLWVMRTAINHDLREFARRSQGRTVLCDLAIKLPRHSLSAQAQALLWNDHLHPTPYGYDRMANIVYQCMKPYLNK